MEDFLLNLCPLPTYKTVVLLGGGYSGRGGIVKTPSIPCNAAVRDLKEMIELRATVFHNQLYYCGGRHLDYGPTKECYKNDGGNWVRAPSMNVKRWSYTMTKV